ncbi:MAG: hypothetical protein RL542_1182, partial [Bacteroidota bacterium]
FFINVRIKNVENFQQTNSFKIQFIVSLTTLVPTPKT